MAFPYAVGASYRLFPVNPNRSYRLLRERCEKLLAQQRQIARGLRGNMNYWFARVYGYVTQFTLQDIDEGRYQYPHMKMQQIVHFHETYARNLEAWQAGQHNRVESNWRAAFAAADDAGSWMGASKSIGNALLPAMEAHIRLDLPRAMAAAYRLHYADIPGARMEAFQADFFAMASVFERSRLAIAPEINVVGTDWNPANWEWLGDIGFELQLDRLLIPGTQRPFFVNAERRMAWQKAVTIARLWGLERDVIERSLRAEMRARHPNLEPFEVAGKDITDFDWAKQPGARPDQPGPRPVHLPAPDPPPAKTYYFRLDRPRGGENLERAVRSNQDLTSLLELASWTRDVRGATLWLVGRSSSEGPEYHNKNLSDARAHLVKFFMWRAGADFDNNNVRVVALGETGSKPTPEYRSVWVFVARRGVSKQLAHPSVRNVPSEVAP